MYEKEVVSHETTRNTLDLVKAELADVTAEVDALKLEHDAALSRTRIEVSLSEFLHW